MKLRITNGDRRCQRGGAPAGLCSSSRRGFTLLEVIVACAIFFMVAFAILELVASGLKSARKLQTHEPDPGIILHALSLTNAFVEGDMSGDYEDIAPGMYPGYRWEAYITEIGSNGLFQIDVLTFNQRKAGIGPATISAQFFRPLSKPGSASKGRP
jgi:prepilin-type N-terminal cleavage/methylation domain-containing protein